MFDSDERWRPLNVDRWMDGEVQVCGLRGCARSSSAALRDSSDRLQYDVGADMRSDSSGNGAMYVASYADGNRAWRYFDYWWFQRFNDALGEGHDHDADWEGATVWVAADRVGQAFSGVSFSSHEGWWSYLRDALRCGGPDSRSCGSGDMQVNVYGANGTHASYPRRCAREGLRAWCHQNQYDLVVNNAPDLTIYLPEGDFDGEQPIALDDDLYDFSAASAAIGADWPRWSGYWGADGKTSVTSPASRLRRPLTEDKRACTDRWSTDASGGGRGSTTDCTAAHMSAQSTAVRCDSWFGPMVAVSVCDPRQLAVAIAAGDLETDRAPSISGSGLDVARGNGLSQAVGDLVVGDRVTLDGAATAGAQLRVRVTIGGVQEEFLLTGLPTKSGDPVTVRVSSSGITARTRSGRDLKIAGRRTVDPRPLAKPRSGKARRLGKRVRVTARTTSQRLLVEVLKTAKSKPSRTKPAPVRRGSAAITLPATKSDRYVRLTSVSNVRVASKSVLIRIR